MENEEIVYGWGRRYNAESPMCHKNWAVSCTVASHFGDENRAAQLLILKKDEKEQTLHVVLPIVEAVHLLG